MRFLATLIVDGVLAGAVYGLVALSFVVVYKTSRVVNFSLGEWMLLASGMVAIGFHVLDLGIVGALVVGLVGVATVALTFNHVVVRRVLGGPPITVIMVTLGVGALIRGVAAVAFRGVPAVIPLSLSDEPWVVGGVPIPLERLVAAAVAVAGAALVTVFFHA